MIALVDGNNFYVSCERVFQPKLKNKPIVILSNNDGCVVSRSNEAKELGIKMAVPYYQIKQLCEEFDVKVFSSNYTLYADMSNRLMNKLNDFSIKQEIYSIDECFLDLSGIPNLTSHGYKICEAVKKHLGLPVCVGIGKTKVLAKFANHLAKKHLFLNGVCNLEELGKQRVDKAMQITSVSEVWGIGRKIAIKLKQMNINTVYDLMTVHPKHMSKIFSVNIERIVYELRGTQCLDIEDIQPANKQIVSSRSFAQDVICKNALLASFNYHVEQAGKKLRRQGLYASQMIVFAHSNRFKDNYISNATSIQFDSATDSFRFMAKYLTQAVDEIYKPGVGYKKSGIVVRDLITTENENKDLFDNINIKYDVLLPTLENIKKWYGKSAIKLASANLSDKWHMNSNLRSKCYTTNIDELLVIS